ncbi:electron transfer flavoprotein subunit alpha/FixB family protein [Bacteroidota bacterium]
MKNKILVFIEQRNGIIKKASLEAAGAAVDIAGKTDIEAEAIAVGNEIDSLDSLGKYGIKKINYIKNNDLQNYTPSGYAKEIAKFSTENDVDIILFPNTAMGKDLAPRVAVKIDAGIAMDCVEYKLEDDNIVLTRPVYAGKAFTDITITKPKKVITLRPNVFKAEEKFDFSPEIEEVNVTDVDLSTKVTDIKKSEGKIDVAEADIIVSGGRGLKDPENFKLIQELAELLGAAQGASRAVVDAGWRPHSEQVGQTGKTVSPTLYVAVGISGAIQHLAGMRSSKYIVAINKDEEAPIFQVADYGIAGDAFEILPPLIEELKRNISN